MSITIEHNVDVEVTLKCDECGGLLTGNIIDTFCGPELYVQNCDSCIADAERDAYQSGHSQGYDEGHADGQDEYDGYSR